MPATTTVLEKITDIFYLSNWFFTNGLRIILVVLVAYLLTRLGRSVINGVTQYFLESASFNPVGDIKPVLEKQRLETLKKGFFSVFRTAVWGLAFLTILPEFGININPLLTGLGIGGLIVGIGSRNVMQDYWSGLFILMEDQFRVGERVRIADLEGIVHNFNIRRTILKDDQGVFSYVPNSQINKVTNYSRQA